MIEKFERTIRQKGEKGRFMNVQTGAITIKYWCTFESNIQLEVCRAREAKEETKI